MPGPRHLLEQKNQCRMSEILEPRVTFVVGAMPVHQSPQSFDWIQMRAVWWDEVQPDSAARPRQPLPHRMMIPCQQQSDFVGSAVMLSRLRERRAI
jgi:hypothetical protein